MDAIVGGNLKAMNRNQGTGKEKLLLGSCGISLIISIIGIHSIGFSHNKSLISSISPYGYFLGISFLALLIYLIIYNNKDGLWIYKLYTLLTLHLLVLLSIPLAADHYFYGRKTDAMDHTGDILDILMTGQIPTFDVYPNSHLLVVSLVEITGLSRFEVMMATPMVFFFVFISAGILLKRHWSMSVRHMVLLAPLLFPFAAPKDTGNYTYFKPYLFGMFFLAFCLSLYFRIELTSDKKRMRLLFVVTSFAAVFYHVLTVFGFLVFFSLMFVFAQTGVEDQLKIDTISSIWPAVLLLLLFSWISFRVEFFFRLAVSRAFTFLTDLDEFLSETSLLFAYSSEASEATGAGYSLLELAVPLYVPVVLFGLVSALAMVYLIFVLYVAERTTVQTKRDYMVVCWLLGTGLFMIGNAVINVINIYPLRPLVLILIFGGPVVASISEINPSISKIVTVLFVIIAVVSLPTIYFDPVNDRTNVQVMESELAGTEHNLQYKNSDSRILHYQTTQHRYASAVIGEEDINRVNHLAPNGRAPTLHDQYPDYGKNRSHITTNQPTYIWLTKYDFWYAYDYRSKYNHGPIIDHVKRDTQANKVYSSGEFHLYLVAANNSSK
ncbi:hypothetical protein [Haloprofundus marisrubri]|uniref:hypothetical protein n=1 Tax=Haloprofundus marisrubri TaxID=1514971 RepID=UPI0012BA7963|nr:hypothetical protein [Haloprofundus marisrubri]